MKKENIEEANELNLLLHKTQRELCGTEFLDNIGYTKIKIWDEAGERSELIEGRYLVEGAVNALTKRISELEKELKKLL